MSPFSHWTAVDHGGGFGEEVTEDQEGAPERETEVTFQERFVADLQIREPGRFFFLARCIATKLY